MPNCAARYRYLVKIHLQSVSEALEIGEMTMMIVFEQLFIYSSRNVLGLSRFDPASHDPEPVRMKTKPTAGATIPNYFFIPLQLKMTQFYFHSIPTTVAIIPFRFHFRLPRKKIGMIPVSFQL